MAVVKLAKWGNSNGLRLSKDILDCINISQEEINEDKIKFEVESNNEDKLILKVIREETPMDRLFKGFEDDPEKYKVEIDWGYPVGNEVW